MTEQGKEDALQAAADWYFRRDGGDLSPEEGEAFRQWMREPANAAAYSRIDSTWSRMGEITPPLLSASPAQRSWRLRFGMAGAFAAMLLVAGYAFDVPLRLEADVMTARGEIRTMVLDDGSQIALNALSAVAVEYSGSERRIRLLRGEAVFTVATDPGRPFVVSAGEGEARALGTIFAVRQQEGGATVTVLESRVLVSYPDRPGVSEELGPDQAVRYFNGNLGPVERVPAEDETAWRRGKLVFVDRPLGEVIGELNRYHSGRIDVVDSAIARKLVSGVFSTDDPVAVVDAIEQSLGVRSTRLTSYLIFLHR